MSELNPSDIEIPPLREGDPRVGHLLANPQGATPEDEPGAKLVIIGFPCETGVLRNGGRGGAAQGPAAIREHFYRLTPDPQRKSHRRLLARTIDLGDLEVQPDLRAAQQDLADVVSPWLNVGASVAVLGGGHETAYGHFLAYANNKSAVGIVNIDAHADVRELIDEGGAERGHSGSPFRQAAEHPSGLLNRYDVFGLQRHSLAATHLDYLDAMKGQWAFASDMRYEDVKKAYNRKQATLATFCLDAVDQSQAPGVSAPATAGLSAQLWLKLAEAAGRSDRVTSMDIVELSPPHDRDGQTARLAAITLWRFSRGLSRRLEDQLDQDRE